MYYVMIFLTQKISIYLFWSIWVNVFESIHDTVMLSSKKPKISASLCLSSLLLFLWFWSKYMSVQSNSILHKFPKVKIHFNQSPSVSHTIIQSWEWNSLTSNLVGQKFKEFCFDLTGLSFDCWVDRRVQRILLTQ